MVKKTRIIRTHCNDYYGVKHLRVLSAGNLLITMTYTGIRMYKLIRLNTHNVQIPHIRLNNKKNCRGKGGA